MALYWPEQGVALEIVDDPQAEPFDRAAHPRGARHSDHVRRACGFRPAQPAHGARGA